MSMRPSSGASRASHIGSGGLSSAARLIEKKKEHDAVTALDYISSELVEELEALAEDCDIMANASQVHATVLEQWPRMFQIINLVVQSLGSEAGNPEDSSKMPATTERLVRLEVSALEQADSGK